MRTLDLYAILSTFRVKDRVISGLLQKTTSLFLLNTPESTEMQSTEERSIQSDPWEAVTMPRRHSQSNEDDGKGKKANKTAASEVMKRIEVIDPDDIKIIKRYDNHIGIVPIEVLSCQQPCGNHGSCCVIAISRSMGQ